MWLRIVFLMTAVAFVAGVGLACKNSTEPVGSACQSDSECPQGQFCDVDGRCKKPASTDVDGSDGTDAGSGSDQDSTSDQANDPGPSGCAHDRECAADQVCDASGQCVAGQACQQDYNCDIDHQYCHPQGKVCKKRSLLCETCDQDWECADPSRGDKCILLPNGEHVCGQACGRLGCPSGYECDSAFGSGSGPNPNQCRSKTMTCTQIDICRSDADCAANQVCQLNSGNCIAKCLDDSSCAAGLKCHYTGHCAAPCSSDADCADDLICCVPGRGFCDENSTGKCRPEGCVLHSECLLENSDALGYCDKTSHTCVAGCRDADPLAVNDCRAGKSCECVNGSATCDSFDCCGDPGQGCKCNPAIQDCSQVSVCTQGQCVDTPCHERVDVSVACARNQMCCGMPDDGYPCPADVSVGECYMAEDPVCKPCQDHPDCDVPGYGFGEKGVCLEDEQGGPKYCHLGCRTNNDCPSTWQCDYVYVQACEQDEQCEASASCQPIRTDQEGNVTLGCHCQTDADCPAPSDSFAFQGHCESMRVCDYSQETPNCQTAKVCHFAKACQCQNCCSELAAP